MYAPLGDSISSHILKPDNESFPGMVFNEAFCLSLASSVGIDVPHHEIYSVGNHHCLLIKRYDRLYDEAKILRIHQEDFCQALGFISSMKYQNEGGPGFKKIFSLIASRLNNAIIAKQQTISWLLFNLIIGNADAHAKNISILLGNDYVKLAPFYDLVSTGIYPELIQKMAMKYGGEYSLNKIASRHLDKLSQEIEVTPRLIKNKIFEIAEKIIDNIDSTKNKYLSYAEAAKTLDKIELFIRNQIKKLWR